MRIVNKEDTREFVDSSGDKLITYAEPTHRMFGLREAVTLKESGHLMKALGVDPTDQAFEDKAKKNLKKKTAKEKIMRNAAISRFEFLAITVRLVVGGREITGADEIKETYDLLPEDTGAWVDGCIAEVWDEAVPTDAEKN